MLVWLPLVYGVYLWKAHTVHLRYSGKHLKVSLWHISNNCMLADFFINFFLSVDFFTYTSFPSTQIHLLLIRLFQQKSTCSWWMGSWKFLKGGSEAMKIRSWGGGECQTSKFFIFNFFLKLLVLWHLPALWVWKKQKSFCLYISYLMYLMLPSQVLL